MEWLVNTVLLTVLYSKNNIILAQTEITIRKLKVLDIIMD